MGKKITEEIKIRTIKLEKVITLDNMLNAVTDIVGKQQALVKSACGDLYFIVDAECVSATMKSVSGTKNIDLGCVHTFIRRTLLHDEDAVAPSVPFFYVSDILDVADSFCVDNKRVREQDIAKYIWKID